MAQWTRHGGTRAEPPSPQSSVWLHRAIQSIDSTARRMPFPHIAESPARVREMDHRSGVERRMTVRGPILMSC